MLADYASEFVVDVWPGVKSVHGTHSFQSSLVRRLNSTLESVLSIKIRISYSQVSMDLWDGFTIPVFFPGVNSQITRKLERIFYFPSEKTCAIICVGLPGWQLIFSAQAASLTFAIYLIMMIKGNTAPLWLRPTANLLPHPCRLKRGKYIQVFPLFSNVRLRQNLWLNAIAK